MSNVFPGERIVVVSPHSDDGVLSLGAAMASWARRGARVELLTVFALDPASDAPAGGWDVRAGFRTEGEAAAGRRAEDAAACAILGVIPAWLPFGSVDYERHGTEVEVRDAVGDAVGSGDTLLLPGFPLTHPDHAWLARLLGEVALSASRLGHYLEPLYVRRESGRSAQSFRRVRAGGRDRLAKWHAIREYRSQLPLLGIAGRLRRRSLSLALTGEAIAWVDGR